MPRSQVRTRSHPCPGTRRRGRACGSCPRSCAPRRSWHASASSAASSHASCASRRSQKFPHRPLLRAQLLPSGPRSSPQVGSNSGSLSRRPRWRELLQMPLAARAVGRALSSHLRKRSPSAAASPVKGRSFKGRSSGGARAQRSTRVPSAARAPEPNQATPPLVGVGTNPLV